MAVRYQFNRNAIAWVVWWVAVFACPVIIMGIGDAYGRSAPPWNDPTYSEAPREWVERIYEASLVVSALLIALAGYYGRGAMRWIAIAAVILMLPFTFAIAFAACAATTGLWP